MERLNKAFASQNSLAALLVAVAVLWLFPHPALPGATLDPSWTMAAENAAHRGLLFGRDFVFVYGPFAVLATRLYESSTFGFVILYHLLLTALFLVPLFWSRRPAILLLFTLAIAVTTGDDFALDARVQVALLVIFLLAIRSRSLVPLALVAAFSPMFLSKFSYLIGALPFLLLADGYRVAALRRTPLLTITALAGVLVGLLATGHPLNLLPELAGNDLLAIAGYGRAMQVDWQGIFPLVAAGLALAAFVPAYVWLVGQRTGGDGRLGRLLGVTLLLGIGWHLFFLFKAGHVRQDLHVLNTWFGFTLSVPVLLAFFDNVRPLTRPQLWLFTALMGGSMLPMAAYEAARFDPADPAMKLRELVMQPIDVLGWLSPGKWQATAAQRVEAERELASRVPLGLSGSADVIPFELGAVIASRQVRYQPRPVPQTYSSYTPELQAMDARHFANPATAPDLLFLKVEEIDHRLPTLGIGPTLPTIAAWYDAIGTSPLGLVLRHRNQPRLLREGQPVASPLRVGEWVRLPPSQPADAMLAHIELPQPAWSKVVGFLGREPLIHLELQFEGGSRKTFRFIPGMAHAFMISPLPRSFDVCDFRGTAAMLDPGSAPDSLARVRAVRIVPTALIQHGYGPGTVSFKTLSIEPGFAAGMAGPPLQMSAAGAGQKCNAMLE